MLSYSHLLLSSALGDLASSGEGLGTLFIPISGFDLYDDYFDFLDYSFGLETYFGGWELKLDSSESNIIGPFTGIFIPTEDDLGLFCFYIIRTSI